MALYIKGMGNISPQQSWDDETLLTQALDHRGDQLKCVEPDYTRWLDAKNLRRMSRILKMGAAAAFMAMKESGVGKPDAIITGTGYGCLEDTGTFLTKMIENAEQALNPTPFIQSTHNTIGSQIALLQNIQGYNQTFTQGPFSFESALLDAILLLKDESELSVLLGGVDELTPASHEILKRFNLYRKGFPIGSAFDLFKKSEKGTVHGEGAAYFVVSAHEGERDFAVVEGVDMFYKASAEELTTGITRFLHAHGSSPAAIDFVLSGRSGDPSSDKLINDVTRDVFKHSSVGMFKHLCGEYPVASAFALWLAARMLKDHHIPDAVVYKDTGKRLRNILVLNQSAGTHHSVILLKSCRDIR